jgi:hypothetical protein
LAQTRRVYDIKDIFSSGKLSQFSVDFLELAHDFGVTDSQWEPFHVTSGEVVLYSDLVT